MCVCAVCCAFLLPRITERASYKRQNANVILGVHAENAINRRARRERTKARTESGGGFADGGNKGGCDAFLSLSSSFKSPPHRSASECASHRACASLQREEDSIIGKEHALCTSIRETPARSGKNGTAQSFAAVTTTTCDFAISPSRSLIREDYNYNETFAFAERLSSRGEHHTENIMARGYAPPPPPVIRPLVRLIVSRPRWKFKLHHRRWGIKRRGGESESRRFIINSRNNAITC